MHEPQLPPAGKGDPTSDGARRRLLWQTVEAFFIKLARIGGEIRGEARGNLRFGGHRRRISGLGVPSAGGYLARDCTGFGEAKKLGSQLGHCWSADFQLHTQN